MPLWSVLFQWLDVFAFRMILSLHLLHYVIIVAFRNSHLCVFWFLFCRYWWKLIILVKRKPPPHFPCPCLVDLNSFNILIKNTYLLQNRYPKYKICLNKISNIPTTVSAHRKIDLTTCRLPHSF